MVIFGVGEVELFHSLLVGDGPGLMIKLVAVAIEGRDRSDVVVLTLGLWSRGNGLLYRLSACLQRRRAGWKPQWIPMAHRDAPIPHRAAGFGFGDRGKPLQGLRIPERMQGPHGLSKRLLDGRPTGDLEVDFTRRLRSRGTSIRACSRLDRQREKSGSEEKYATTLACHTDNLPGGSLTLAPMKLPPGKH